MPANSAQHMLHSSSSTAGAAVENTAAATTWSPHCLHDAAARSAEIRAVPRSCGQSFAEKPPVFTPGLKLRRLL